MLFTSPAKSKRTRTRSAGLLVSRRNSARTSTRLFVAPTLAGITAADSDTVAASIGGLETAGGMAAVVCTWIGCVKVTPAELAVMFRVPAAAGAV